jgi:hypothetical protein
MPTAKDLPSFDECLKSYDAHFWGEKGTIEEGKGMRKGGPIAAQSYSHTCTQSTC